MKRLLILMAAISIGAAALSAQNTWEGTAAMGRYGEFPPTGLYAASNSFPRNSIVDVTNVRTGKTARVIIAKNLSDPGLFIVLSEEAARELELGRADVASVRISPVFTPGAESGANARDLPYSQDPDVNPQARLADSNTVINAREVPGRVPAAPRPEAVPLPLQPGSAPDEAASVADPKSLPAVGPDTKPEAPLSQAPPATAVTIAPPAQAPAAEAKPEAPAEAPASPEASLAAPAAEAAPALAEAAVAPAVPEAAIAQAQPAEPESDWARPSASNSLDQSLEYAAGRSPQKNLFPPPREENMAAIETPKAPSAEVEPAGQALPEAAPEGESRPANDSVPIVQPPASSLDAHLAEARPAEELFEARPDLVYPEAAAETARYFNDVERIAETPSGAPAEKPSPGMERPAGVETVLRLEPAELRPPVQPKPGDYLPTPAEPAAARLALALDEPEPASAQPGSVGPVKAAETGTLQKLETIIASIPPKQEPVETKPVEKPIETKPAVKPVETKPIVKPIETKPANGLPIVAALEKNSYYLQLGVFSNPQSARNVLSNLGPAYPVAVLAAGGDKTLYRVFVGPVREDEKGGLLHLFKAKGFKDVFVRKGS